MKTRTMVTVLAAAGLISAGVGAAQASFDPVNTRAKPLTGEAVDYKQFDIELSQDDP
jgi:hypothetical protein